MLLFPQSSLNRLVEILEEAQPFFVRCIRSNAEKVISYKRVRASATAAFGENSTKQQVWWLHVHYTCVLQFDFSLVQWRSYIKYYSLMENVNTTVIFSSSKVLSLVVVVVMVMGGWNPRNVCEGDNESTLIPFSSLYISYSSSKEHMLEKQGILSIMMISFILITVLQ